MHGTVIYWTDAIVSGILNRRKCYLWFNPNRVVTPLLNNMAQNRSLDQDNTLYWTLPVHWLDCHSLELSTQHWRDIMKERWCWYKSTSETFYFRLLKPQPQFNKFWIKFYSTLHLDGSVIDLFYKMWLKGYLEPWTIGNIYFTTSVKNILIVSVAVMFSCYLTDWHTILHPYIIHCTAS